MGSKRFGLVEKREALKANVNSSAKTPRVTLVIFNFFDTISWDHKSVLDIGCILVRTHRKKLEVSLKCSVKKGHFTTLTAPQFRSQRTEPLIPNPLHCIKYCVDAALFWLPTQILICKMLIKSEIKGWEQSKMASECWGQWRHLQGLAGERWPITSHLIALIWHHDLLQNFPPLFLKTTLRMTHVHIWRQGKGTLLFFRRKVRWRWAALSTVGKPGRPRGTAVMPWGGVCLAISQLTTTWLSTAQFWILTKNEDNRKPVRRFK